MADPVAELESLQVDAVMVFPVPITLYHATPTPSVIDVPHVPAGAVSHPTVVPAVTEPTVSVGVLLSQVGETDGC